MPDLPFQAPKTLGGYRIVRLIGTGGMGAVYLGTGAKGKQVAVKVLHAHLARDEAFVKRFEREARMGTVLKSEHIVRLIDYGEDRGLRYLVVEYVDGGSLKDELARGKVPTERALRIARDVALALVEAHRHGVIHRDIKPENILLASDGTVKVNDFGVAKQAGVTSLTFPGGFVGSLAYASPEHVTGQVVEASDIYSLGVTLYHMLTGDTPFRGDYVEILRQHREEPVPEEPLRGVPDEVRAIVTRCMAKVPEDRPTAKELVKDIDIARAGVAAETTASVGVIATTLVAGAEETQVAPIAAELRPARTLNPATWFGRSRFNLVLRNASPSDAILEIRTQTGSPHATVSVPQGLHVPGKGTRKVPVTTRGFKRAIVTPSKKDPASQFTVLITGGDGSPPAVATATAGGSWLPFGGLALVAAVPLVALLAFAVNTDDSSEDDAAVRMTPTPTRQPAPTPTLLAPQVTRVSCPTSIAPATEVQCFAGVNGSNTVSAWEVDGQAAADTGTQLVTALEAPGVHLITFKACNQSRCSEAVSVEIQVVAVGTVTPAVTPTPPPGTPLPTPAGGCPAHSQGAAPGAALTAGCAAVIASGAGLFLRDAPGVNGPNPKLLPANSVVCILGSPTETDGVTWWSVRRDDGVAGWSADENPRALGEVLLAGNGQGCPQ